MSQTLNEDLSTVQKQMYFPFKENGIILKYVKNESKTVLMTGIKTVIRKHLCSLVFCFIHLLIKLSSSVIS